MYKNKRLDTYQESIGTYLKEFLMVKSKQIWAKKTTKNNHSVEL